MNILKCLFHKVKLFCKDGVMELTPLTVYLAVRGEEWRLYSPLLKETVSDSIVFANTSSDINLAKLKKKKKRKLSTFRGRSEGLQLSVLIALRLV